MSDTSYLILAYVLGAGLLWGYGLTLWLQCRSFKGGNS